MTIYEALRVKLGRAPTNVELREEVRRIIREGFEQAATNGRLPYQRRA